MDNKKDKEEKIEETLNDTVETDTKEETAENEVNEVKNEADNAPKEEDKDDDKFSKLTEELFKAKEENTELNNELNTLKDRLVRINAEYDNFRKRTAKEKEGIYADACNDVLKEMLGVLDNLERAVAVENSSVEDLKNGVDMTMRQFKNAFDKLGVEEIDASGEFDPHLHQAVMHVDDPDLGKNVVADVLQKGYKKGDKVLRYTIVKVAN